MHHTFPLTLRPWRYALVAAVSATLLSACGGGGGGSSSSSTSSTWAQQAYVKAANAEASDLFGYSVAISGDTMAVGAYGEDSALTVILNGSTASSNNSASSNGAVYVYTRSGTSWTQQAYIKSAAGTAGDEFGFSVALSGDTLAVGVYKEDSNQTTITNGTSGSSDNSAADAGAVYVYTRSGTSWSQQAYIKAPNAEAGDYFGYSIALDDATLVVGAPLESSNQTSITNSTTASSDNSASGAGAAYVFVRSGTTWSQQSYIKAPNAEAGDYFGNSVAIDDDTLVVGAYCEDSNQTSITNGTSASSNNSASAAGAAYVFVRAYNSLSGIYYWAQQAYLKAPNAETDDNFGRSVAISGDTVVVGAHQEDSNQTTITNGSTASSDNSAASSGAAYVFLRSGTSWTQQAYLKAPNAEASDAFGASVAISGDTIVVSAAAEDSSQTSITNGTTASSDNSASNAGAAYVFVRSGTSWTQQAYLKAPNAGASDYFGSSVAIDGTTLVVGAYQESSSQTSITNGTTASSDNSATYSGAVYVFYSGS